jgi:1-pyrroline-5-carboxylate dehydrogenase
MASGDRIQVVQPHRHTAVLGTTAESSADEWQRAVDAALAAAPAWRETSYDDRAAVLLKAADLLAGPWRETLNGATMLGQSKTAFQAEIDAACELIDFLRFNVAFGRQVLAEQPVSSPGVWNRMDHRPLEGFVLAITPFNFTAIAGNLPLAPALMGNTVVWKPSPTQQLAAHFTMRLLEAAGLPPGVLNMVTGFGTSSAVAVEHPSLAGIHFTGSTPTFQHLWQQVGSTISRYRSYPRLVGETGGKDFVLAHASADVAALEIALVRGAFEYQGQKCSAASRAYVPRSIWEGGLRDSLADRVRSLTYGDVTDLSNFGGAVIDRRAWDRLSAVVRGAASDPALTVLAGGSADDSEGYFVDPTVLETTDPTHDVMTKEFFGPVLGVYVYDDWADVLPLVDSSAPYALTGAVFAQDPYALAEASTALRFAAGNFYVNDKPTGAVVGQQPFGGARASGTNDKAGSVLNLLRWTSPRTIKTTSVPPTLDHAYPHMG